MNACSGETSYFTFVAGTNSPSTIVPFSTVHTSLCVFKSQVTEESRLISGDSDLGSCLFSSVACCANPKEPQMIKVAINLFIGTSARPDESILVAAVRRTQVRVRTDARRLIMKRAG